MLTGPSLPLHSPVPGSITFVPLAALLTTITPQCTSDEIQPVISFFLVMNKPGAAKSPPHIILTIHYSLAAACPDRSGLASGENVAGEGRGEERGELELKCRDFCKEL